MKQLMSDIKEYLGYTDEQLKDLNLLTDVKLQAMKRNINNVRLKRETSQRAKFEKNQMRKRVEQIFEQHPDLKKKRILGSGLVAPSNTSTPKKAKFEQPEIKRIKSEGKPKILFIYSS